MFLSYSGGPVFNLSRGTAAKDAAPASAANGNPSAAEGNAVDAARKGSALVARREFESGLAYLSRAVELSPNDPEFYFQRGNAYWASGQADLALADYDRATQLKADFLPAYVSRAQIQVSKDNKSAALLDLKSADKLASAQADLRFDLGGVFTQLDLFPEAIAQYQLWMDNHPNDSRIGWALMGRCYDRVMANQDLSGAMNDCNAVMRRSDKHDPNYASALVGRAAVHMRMGEYGKVIEDSSDALKLDPKKASALYLRGVAEARKGKKDDGDKDLAASKELDPKLAERYAKRGIAP
jgi:tetratricopeptide (TPR) repeat protein